MLTCGEGNPLPWSGLATGADDDKVAKGTSEGKAMRGKVGEGARRTRPATPRIVLLVLLLLPWPDIALRDAPSTKGVLGITTDKCGWGGGLSAVEVDVEMEVGADAAEMSG